MLVTFSCQECADITMFGDVALRLLDLMGQSGKIPGALLAEDVPRALERLESAVETEKQTSEPEESDDADDEQAVSLSRRAWPLVEMLKTAGMSKCGVMWDSKTPGSAE